MAEWSQNDLLTAALMNQKTVYVISGTAPGTAYDGQFYVDTSTDPPTVKVYDLTNTQWMEHHPVYYEEQAGGWANPTVSPITNGTLVVTYNSTQAGTRLYGYSNSSWTSLVAITAINWRSDMIAAMISGASATTIAANTIISGFNNYTTLTINSGRTLTVGDNPAGIVCDALVNNGIISKVASPLSLGGPSASTGVGGAGGGTLVIAANTITQSSGLIRSNGVDGSDGTTHAANAVGFAASGVNITICVAGDSPGNGGIGGDTGTGARGAGGTPGGGGGGNADTWDGGNGGNTTVVSAPTAGALDALVLGMVTGGDAAWNRCLGGGGGGASDGATGDGGGGGGGGGCIYISCMEIDNTNGVIIANGGDGGDGGTQGVDDAAGGGGGGGIIYVFSETNTGSGTITVTGGTQGAGDGTAADDGAVGVAKFYVVAG